MKIAELENKSVLILGLGREGLSTYRLLRRLFPTKKFGVADVAYNPLKKNGLITEYIGPNYLKSLKDYEVIIKTPGLSPYQGEIQKALHDKNKILTSQTDLFLDNFEGSVIGVTGTKGKSTVASMIYHLLKTTGYNVKLGGNIGKPSLELLPNIKNNKWVVLEMSSHQLWNIKKSPHISVFLNIYPEHLDYSTFEDYFKAKANIAKYQSEKDYFIYNKSFSTLVDLANKTKAKTFPFGPVKTVNDQNKKVLEAIGKILSIGNSTIDKSIDTFIPLPGRMENIGTYKGIAFYDDYLATIPEATLNALHSIKQPVGTLFLGGWDRQQNFKAVIDEVIKQKIPVVVLFPPTGKRIQKDIKIQNSKIKTTINYKLVKNMKEAIKFTYQYCPKGKIALFSTGAPSFGIYKDYRHRSRQYKYWVKKLGKY